MHEYWQLEATDVQDYSDQKWKGGGSYATGNGHGQWEFAPPVDRWWGLTTVNAKAAKRQAPA